MIKNQLYPYVEEYINSYLYGFTKEQLDVGIVKGEIKLENLNLRPDGVNESLDKGNFPFWLKAGLISKINFGCSLMNFIGEKPIEGNFEGVNIILTPSYKWIIQNLDNFLTEDLKEMKMEYSAVDNNSVNIFGKKINVLDNTIFKKEQLEEFFKDKTKISNFLNKILIDCFQFYYSKSYAFVLKLKNVHIRFEDDELINYLGNIACGIRVDSFELTLSSEGSMKKNNFKISKLDFYWENNAKLLIPNNILYDSIKNGTLNDNYYKNLSKIKFQNFSYRKNTKFIVQNFNCLCNFGTKAITQGKIDIFAKKENNYKLYIQFASNEIKINFFPDLFIIRDNFQKYMKDFTVISQAQEFKPMKKPYNIKNRNFMEILSHINKNKNGKLDKRFTYKRKMVVRDWLFYFYWCYKCKTSIYNFNSNPIRAEFSRFFNMYYKNELEKLNDLEEKKTNDEKNIGKEDKIWRKEKPNPDKINLTLNIDIKIKGINLNLHPFISSSKDINDFIIIKIANPDLKFILSQEKFEFNFSIKEIILGPNKLKSGEKLIISNNIIKKQEININTEPNRNQKNNNIINSYSNYLTENDLDSNTGITGFMKKYNPNYSNQLKVIDKVMEKINDNAKRNSRHQSHNNSFTENNTENTENNITQNNKEKDKAKINKNYNSSRENISTNFSQNLINTYEATPSLLKMELKRQKNEFHISQAVNHYNNTKSKNGIPDKNIPRPENHKIPNTVRLTKNPNTKIISTGKVLPLNLLEIISNNNNDGADKNKNDNSPCFSIKYSKTNNTGIDKLKILFGIIRINLFTDYIVNCINILNDYNINRSIIKSEKNNLLFFENSLKLDRNLYAMKKYILQKVEKMPNADKNELIKNYINYLKNELEKGKLIYQSDSSELNYIFSYFSEGIEIIFDYNILECIYYNNKNNKYCGKALVPSPQFNFKINKSNISLKLYDFEIDFNDLDNANILFKSMQTIFEDKFKFTKILIEPCMQNIKKELEDKEKEEELDTEEHINVRNEFERNINRILNNNANTKNINQKRNMNKMISENDNNKVSTIDDINYKKEREKERKDENGDNKKKLDKELEENIQKENQTKKEVKEIKENKLTENNDKKINKIKKEIDIDNPNNIIVPKENKIIPYELTDERKNPRLVHKKNINREKKKLSKSFKSKTTDIKTITNVNNNKEEKDNQNKKLVKKNSNKKINVDKKVKDNKKTTKSQVPVKKKVPLNLNKVPLKNIENKNNKINKTDKNITNV